MKDEGGWRQGGKGRDDNGCQQNVHSGFRLVAISLLDISSKTLVYGTNTCFHTSTPLAHAHTLHNIFFSGSGDSGKTVLDGQGDVQLLALMKASAKHLNIRGKHTHENTPIPNPSCRAFSVWEKLVFSWGC